MDVVDDVGAEHDAGDDGENVHGRVDVEDGVGADVDDVDADAPC